MGEIEKYGTATLVCGHCQQGNPTYARFCLACGQPFGVANIAAGHASTVAAEPSALPAERRRVSILFADIAGSTGLIAALDPEAVDRLLSDVIETMTAAVHQFGGFVGHQEGDGILALFGWPLPCEDHALRACRAALRVQSVMALRRWGVGAQTAVQVRLGINAGEVLARTVATDLLREYTAVGAATHIAAKAQQAAQPGSVLITAQVLELARSHLAVRPAPALVIKGLNTPIPMFELLGVTATAARFQPAGDATRSAFVGRATELALLTQAAARCADGLGLAVAVVGDAGLGKSRLLWTCRQSLLAQGWVVVATQSTSLGARSPYYAICKIVEAMFSVEAADNGMQVSEKIRQCTARTVLDLPPLLALLNRLDDSAGSNDWAALDAGQRRERTSRAVVAALLQCAHQRPTLVMVEDLHWADSGTVEVIDKLIGRLGSTPLLVLLEFRPGSGLDFTRYARCQTLHLSPLPEVDAIALFRNRVGPDSSLDRLQQQFVERVAGNPFFIEEGVRMLAETGALAGDARQYRLGLLQGALAIPATVADVLQARIARLPEQQRRLVQMAAVIGRQVHLPMLSLLAELAGGVGLTSDRLAPVLKALVLADLLTQAGTATDTDYAFKHAFTQEVAYASMLRSEQQRLHSLLVDWLESQRLPALPDRVELLAHHAVRASRWTPAITYLQLAARRAFDRAALREAVRALDEALRVAGNAPSAQRPAHWAIDLRLALRGPLLALGHMDRVSTELDLAEKETEFCDDPVRRCRVLVYLACQRWLLGDHRQAVAAGQRALALAEPLDDPSLLIPAREYVGGALHALGQHQAACAMLSANVASLPESAPGGLFGMAGLPAVLSRATRCWSREHCGHFGAAADDATAALRIARAARHGFSLQAACFAAGNLHLARGDFDQARDVLQEGLAASEQERGMWRVVLGPLLALALIGCGEMDAARALIDKTAPRPDLPIVLTSTRIDIIAVYAAIGRLELASLHGEDALRQARRRHEPVNEAFALRLLGELAQCQDRPDPAQAEAHYSAALALAEGMGMQPLAARCRLGLGWSLAAQCRRALGLQQLQAAGQTFQDLKLPYWLARVQQARGQIESAPS